MRLYAIDGDAAPAGVDDHAALTLVADACDEALRMALSPGVAEALSDCRAGAEQMRRGRRLREAAARLQRARQPSGPAKR